MIFTSYNKPSFPYRESLPLPNTTKTRLTTVVKTKINNIAKNASRILRNKITTSHIHHSFSTTHITGLQPNILVRYSPVTDTARKLPFNRARQLPHNPPTCLLCKIPCNLLCHLRYLQSRHVQRFVHRNNLYKYHYNFFAILPHSHDPQIPTLHQSSPIWE